MAISYTTSWTRIKAERERQDKKFPAGVHAPLRWVTILAEEFGEVAKAVMQDDVQATEEELVQVGAVVIAWLEDIEIGRAREKNAI